MIDLLLIPFILICVGGVLFLFFESTLYNRLSTRIAALIFASGPVALIILFTSNALLQGTEAPHWVRILEVLVIVLCGPLILGLLAARFVRRPLHQFNNAVSSLERSDYKIQLEPAGIREFDEVFVRFNSLIHRLQHEEKLRKDLVSDTSHELNTPLTTMIGQLTAMQEGKLSATPERITILKEQAERLAELVSQLDTYTKARSPSTSKQEDIKLKKFVDDVIGHVSFELTQHGIQPKLSIAADYVIHGDRGALQRILTNLIQNTLRYAEATEISIEATSRSLTYSDNGIGVPAESLPYLFERFYRVDKSRSRETGGLGLGLAIVRELAESQGWIIDAKAGDPGLTFVIGLKA